MPLPFVPKISYGSPVTVLNFIHPQKLWTPSSRSIGGANVSEAGIPETFIIRRDQLVSVVLRFEEAEWTDVDNWLAFAQSGQSFTYQFDQNVAGTAYTVYLEDPALGDGEVSPSREPFTKLFTLPIVLRSTNTAVKFDVRIF